MRDAVVSVDYCVVRRVIRPSEYLWWRTSADEVRL